jgi:hypothetical protein
MWCVPCSPAAVMLLRIAGGELKKAGLLCGPVKDLPL